MTVAGATAEKPSRLVGPNEPVRVLDGPRRFVGRGGEKLDAALAAFSIDASDRWALDAGASTGGFTDCLLRRGAGRVPDGAKITYRREEVRCGKANCTRCPHGPYWYAYWREDGRLRSRYLGSARAGRSPGGDPPAADASAGR